MARSTNESEMPVNFKAEVNGTYTLNFDAEGVSFDYLHLVDKVTGNDVDLLANPSYSFEAKTTDYEGRFKLVFVANSEDGPSTGSGTFAFNSNGNWIISNPSTNSASEASLEVIDIMGRVLNTRFLNGNANINLNFASGVYILRLVSGNNVKVQKVVVR